MTRPDMVKKIRNMFVISSVIAAAVSYGAASTAAWNGTLQFLDYWLYWVATISFIGTVASVIAGVVFHVTYLDEIRSN